MEEFTVAGPPIKSANETMEPNDEWGTETHRLGSARRRLTLLAAFRPSIATHAVTCGSRSADGATTDLIGRWHPLVAPMLTEHLHQEDRYDLELVEFCDEALARIHRGGG